MAKLCKLCQQLIQFRPQSIQLFEERLDALPKFLTFSWCHWLGYHVEPHQTHSFFWVVDVPDKPFSSSGHGCNGHVSTQTRVAPAIVGAGGLEEDGPGPGAAICGAPIRETRRH
jgi:hypothetical protein